MKGSSALLALAVGTLGSAGRGWNVGPGLDVGPDSIVMIDDFVQVTYLVALILILVLYWILMVSLFKGGRTENEPSYIRFQRVLSLMTVFSSSPCVIVIVLESKHIEASFSWIRSMQWIVTQWSHWCWYTSRFEPRSEEGASFNVVTRKMAGVWRSVQDVQW
jgi:hypothetical protein